MHFSLIEIICNCVAHHFSFSFLAASFLILICLPVRTLNEDGGFDNNGWHRIHNAAIEGNATAIEKELDSGVSVDVEARGKYSSGQTPLFFAATFNKVDAMKFLLFRNANVNKAM